MLFKVDKTTLFLRNKKWEFVKKECLKYKSDTVHCFYFMTHCYVTSLYHVSVRWSNFNLNLKKREIDLNQSPIVRCCYLMKFYGFFLFLMRCNIN